MTDPWQLTVIPRSLWERVARWIGEADTEHQARTIALWFAVGNIEKAQAETLMGPPCTTRAVCTAACVGVGVPSPGSRR